MTVSSHLDMLDSYRPLVVFEACSMQFVEVGFSSLEELDEAAQILE